MILLRILSVTSTLTNADWLCAVHLPESSDRALDNQ